MATQEKAKDDETELDNEFDGGGDEFEGLDGGGDVFGELDEFDPDAEIPVGLRAACSALAPDDELNKRQKLFPERLNRSERKELLRRKLACVKACVVVSRRYLKGVVRTEVIGLAKPFVDSPSASTESRVGEALAATDLVETIRARPTKQQQDKGQPGNLVPRARMGTSGRQAEYYTLKAVTAEPASKAAAYLYSVAMACAREFPRMQSPPKPSDWAHPLIVGSINAMNPRI